MSRREPAVGWRPRLLALDVDGTLVGHDGVLPHEVVAAVRRVVEAGVPVAIATGRGWHGTQPIVDALGLPPGPHVCSNGAVTVRYPPLQLTDVVTFDPRDVIAAVREQAPSALIAVEEIGKGYRLTEHFPEGDLSGQFWVETPEQLGSRPVTRVILRDPEASPEEFQALAQRLGLHGVSYFVGWTAWLDIAPEGVDKATGLARVCRHLGIEAADVLALGDGWNDVEMLRWAGRGVAIGDAPEGVQAAATAVTGRFADGGTAAELARWF